MSKEQRANLILSFALTCVVLLVYAGSVGLLWWQGVFDVPESEEGARVVAAAIALVGGLFAALLTFVGVLLTYSVDARTVEIKADAENRLKLETFIRAVRLLSTDTGGKTSRSQHAGTLFALSELHHLPFALALLDEMWPVGDVSSSSACWLIDKCLRSDDKFVQKEAANILVENAEKLTEETEGYELPEILIESWPIDLPIPARQRILVTFALCIKSRPLSQWKDGVLGSLIFRLDRIRREDSDSAIKNGAILFLNVLLNDTRMSKHPSMRLGSETIKMDSLRSEIASSLASAKEWAGQENVNVAGELNAWSAEASES